MPDALYSWAIAGQNVNMLFGLRFWEYGVFDDWCKKLMLLDCVMDHAYAIINIFNEIKAILFSEMNLYMLRPWCSSLDKFSQIIIVLMVIPKSIPLLHFRLAPSKLWCLQNSDVVNYWILRVSKLRCLQNSDVVSDWILRVCDTDWVMSTSCSHIFWLN